MATLSCLPPSTGQALVVIPTKPGCFLAELTAWERNGSQWRCSLAAVAATIGRGGMVPATDKTEGDGCTPAGVYRLALVFGSEPAVRTAMPYRQTTAADYWVDDPSSSDYNRWVSGKVPSCSFEPLLRSDGLYRYGVVIEYNTQPVVAGKGSAIFMHLWKAPGEPTAGCVAMAEADLLRLLAWLEPLDQPVIVLGEADSCPKS